MKSSVETICGICPGGCNVRVEVDGQNITKIRPSNENFPSALCMRGAYANEIIHSKNRVQTPLIRVGKKGEGKFRAASWDEALEVAANGFKNAKQKYGAKSVASHSGRGAFEQSCDDFISLSNPLQKNTASFFEPFGSKNNASVASLCYCSFGIFAPMSTFGFSGTRLFADIENCDTLVVWGANPTTDSPPFNYQRVLKAKRRGAKIISIDHFKSDIVKKSDFHILVRSGTDGALALGILNLMIENELFDKDFAKNHTLGFDELAKHVKEFTPQKVEQITGVSASELEILTNEICKSASAPLIYTGLEYSNSGVSTIRAVYSIWALSGNLDVKGGLLINPKNNQPRIKPYKTQPITCHDFFSEGEFSLFHSLIGQPQFLKFPDAVLKSKPYKVAALLNIGSAIVNAYPNSKLFKKAISELEHYVVIDRVLSEDALYADVVLPATTYFEDESYRVYPNYIKLKKQVIKPIGEAKPNIFILHELASRLGYGNLYPKDKDELLEMAFELTPEILESLKKDGVYKFKPSERIYKKYEFETPSKKFELKSSLLESHGYDALPRYIEPKESPLSNPSLAKDFPLVLNTGCRIQTNFRTQYLNIKGLLKHQDRPYILINPQDAKQRNIANNDEVWLKTKRGKSVFFAKVTNDIPKNEIEANYGGGSKYQNDFWSKCNLNDITDETNIDEISGFPCFKALLCEVELC